MGALLTPILARLADGDDGAAGETRHIDKLDASGRLGVGYLVKALRDGQLGLFEAALARLGGYDRGDLKAAIASPDRPELLALALAGVGLDRGAFPSVLGFVRGLASGRPGGGERSARRALGAFGPFKPEVTAAAFRRACQSSAEA